MTLLVPTCSRCANKGLQCLCKPSNAISNSGKQDVSVGRHVPLVQQVEAAPSHNDLPEQTSSDSSLKDISVRRGNSPYDLDHPYVWNSFNRSLLTDTPAALQSNPKTRNVDGTEFSDEMLDLISSDPLSWNYLSDTFLLPQIHHFKDRLVLSSYCFDISTSFVPLNTKSILEKRDLKAGPYGSTLSRAYCMSILKSYPGMLCHNDGTLPPFIHLQSRPSPWKMDPKCINSHTIPLPEPLAICSSIMQMYMARSPGNLAFIWRTIQRESQRIEEEVSIMFRSLSLMS